MRKLIELASLLQPRPAPPAVVPETIVSNTIENIQDQIRRNYGAGIGHAYDEFDRLVERLARSHRTATRSMTEIATPPTNDGPRIFLRIDVDADPWTGLRMARELAMHGIAGSIFLLHTAPYYGFHAGEIFVRHGWMPSLVRDLVVSGIEVGLHNDVMGLAGTMGDPAAAAAAVETEIQWLRSLGAGVRGTVGHNSIRGQGAESSEVFRERRLIPDRLDPRRAKLPIERLDETALGLAYEGTAAIPRSLDRLDLDSLRSYLDASRPASIGDPEWMRTYLVENPLHDWATDFQIWAIGGGEWGLGGRNGDGTPRFEWNVGVERMLEWIDELPAATSTMIVLHPEYFRS